jgi:hypothetical protein
MPSIRAWLVLTGMGAACLSAGQPAAAQAPPGPSPKAVELAPFAGFQFGGSFTSAAGQPVTLGAGLDYGATLDVHLPDSSWSLEALYSRQGTNLGGFEATVERIMGGVVEEKGDGPTSFFGVALLGATRFVPGPSGYRSLARFTIGLGLGVKYRFSDHFGLRAEGRGYLVTSETGGGIFCSGGCLFTFNASGLWQGDLSAGVVLAF